MTARRPVLVSSVVAVVVAALPASAQSASPRPAAGWEPWRAAFARWAGPLAATKPARRCARRRRSARARRSGVPRVPVSLPQTVALSRATRTLYATADTGVVSVIDADRCNARRDSGCAAPVAVIDGAGSGDVAVDERSGTGYVTNPSWGR